MADVKTKPTAASVEKFLASVGSEKRRKDCEAVIGMMRAITGEPPRMCGPGVVGFGSCHYKYESGREGDWFLTGVSPRKQNLTLYITPGFDAYGELMGKLGRYKTGKSCLYINSLEDVHLPTLKRLIALSVKHLRERIA
jgi:hypothetical protein